MQQWAYTTKVHDINELKHILFDQRLAWFGIRHQQWCNWWLAQTSVCVCVCVFMPKHVIWFNIFNFMLILWKLEAKWCYCVKYDRILLFLIVLCISQEIVPNCLRYTGSGKYKIIFLQIHHWVPSWKNFKYRSIFANAMHMVCFFSHTMPWLNWPINQSILIHLYCTTNHMLQASRWCQLCHFVIYVMPPCLNGYCTIFKIWTRQ